MQPDNEAVLAAKLQLYGMIFHRPYLCRQCQMTWLGQQMLWIDRCVVPGAPCSMSHGLGGCHNDSVHECRGLISELSDGLEVPQACIFQRDPSLNIA